MYQKPDEDEEQTSTLRCQDAQASGSSSSATQDQHQEPTPGNQPPNIQGLPSRFARLLSLHKRGIQSNTNVQPTPLALSQEAEAPLQPTPQRPVAPVQALQLPARNGQGTLGRKIPLSANHFLVMIKNLAVYHYDVDIVPEPPQSQFKKIIEGWMASDHRIGGCLPVYDLKKNIYTAHRIPGVNSKVTVKYSYEEKDRENPSAKEFTIALQPTGEVEVDLSALADYCKSGKSTDPPLRPIQALDIALKYGAQQRPDKVMLGSCLLSQPIGGRIEDLGGGVEVWFGHFQSLRLGWKPFLNVDATQRAFVMEGQVHHIMAKMYNRDVGQTLNDRDYEDFSKKIATLQVKYSRGSYVATVRCNGLKGPANRETFLCEGRSMTVQQYFEEKMKIKLQFPGLPCVWVGNREKKNLVPMELCTMAPGQEYRRKLTDVQTTAMIKVAATPADVRKKKILSAVQNMKFSSDPYGNKFGITVDEGMVQLEGRVLPPPTLSYGNGEAIPNGGTWNMQNRKFIDAKKMLHFGVLSIARNLQERNIQAFVNALLQAGREMGMEMGNQLFIKSCQFDALENEMRVAKATYPALQILFVILNRKGDPAYELVKRIGDLDLLLTTQCVQQRNVMGRNGPDKSTMANICLKLNAKLGGINNLIAQDSRPKILTNEQVIIFGADVTHPDDQRDSTRPSIAAVVASLDPRAAQYACEIRIQRSKQEFIEDMEGMIYNLLLKFNRATAGSSTGKPQRIIFYRDGVSEGQFAKILEWELSAIRKACLRLESGYNPPITFVIVQKRHHTRLFADNPRDETGRGKNVPPGTVVDTMIVHPTENDFYLVSHAGIQGTSRPTHYHLLWDDSNLSADELQVLTYYLCHLFVRCTRSVSYPAPCYYAHLVAFRGRQYYDGLVRDTGRSLSSAELQQHIDSVRKTNFMFFV